MGLGFEIEWARPILTSSLKYFAGDTHIYKLPLLGQLVSDSRKLPKAAGNYSNVELVSFHFDQLAGDVGDAMRALDTRLGVIQSLFKDLYSKPVDTDLRKLITTDTIKLFEEFIALCVDPATRGSYVPQHLVDAVIAPETVKITDDNCLYVHYTVGFPPESLGAALDWIGVETRPGETKNNRKEHAIMASKVAAETATATKDLAKVAPALQPELRGFLALVFTQIAAFADMADNSPGGTVKGQPKNYVAALSRVPLQTIYNALADDVKAAINGNQEEIYVTMGDQIISDCRDGDSRRPVPGLDAVTLKDYAMSAFGTGALVSQQRVFGGMNETDLDTRVRGSTDPDKTLLGGRGVPVELRAVGKPRAPWADFVSYTRRLLELSRTMALPNPKGPRMA